MDMYRLCIKLIIFHFATGSDMVPCLCKYDTRNLVADCSHKGLDNINEITTCVPKTVKGLSLSYNTISALPVGIFSKWPFLRSINLDHNHIEHLENDSFAGLPKLERLSVSHNRLKHNNSVAIGAFKNLRTLRWLTLQGNCNVHVSRCVYPDEALSFAGSLQYLHLDGIPNTNFGPGFSRLKHLNYLHLGDDNSFCSLQLLTEATFSVFKDIPITYLKIESCEIKNLRPNVFRWMHNLTTLIVTKCNKLCSDGIENATIGLNETQIKTIRFNFWCKHPPFFPQLVKNNFQSLTSTSLKYLDLGWNNIYFIDPSVMENLPLSVQYISLKENSIITANFLIKMERLVNLKTFDASYQSHFQESVDLYRQHNSGLPNNDLYLQNNNHSIKYNLSVRAVQILFDESLKLPRNLQILYMNNIKLGYPVTSLRFAPNKLKYIRASSCMLTAFLGPLYGLHDLKYLDISNNRFQFIHPLTFIDMKKLLYLFLQYNSIGKSLVHDVNGETFSALKQLIHLDLSNNDIKDLPYKIFRGQINLNNLSVAENSLKNISFDLNPMTKLCYLNLSGNEIEYISEKNLKFLEKIAEHKDIFLDLSNNSLACTCDHRKFIAWLAKTKVNIIGKDELKCLYINKTFVSLTDIKAIQETLEYDCTTWMVVTSCVMGFIGLLLLSSIFALLHHKRWQLRYLWYIGKLKIDPYHHPDDREQPLMHIDAYISYEQHYAVGENISLHQIVTDQIYPYFEERGYALKIREEFDGNERLYNAIPETIRKSRKVIVFLTPSFCQDYWNIFEFNLAAYQGIYMRRNVVIPVLLGDVCVANLTPEIRSFIKSKLKSNDVIRFPTLATCIGMFMEHLESLLGR